MTTPGVQKIMAPYKINRKFPYECCINIKPFAKNQNWQLRLGEVSLMMFLWWKFHHWVLLVQELWHQSQTDGCRSFKDIAYQTESCKKSVKSEKMGRFSWKFWRLPNL